MGKIGIVNNVTDKSPLGTDCPHSPVKSHLSSLMMILFSIFLPIGLIGHTDTKLREAGEGRRKCTCSPESATGKKLKTLPSMDAG